MFDVRPPLPLPPSPAAVQFHAPQIRTQAVKMFIDRRVQTVSKGSKVKIQKNVSLCLCPPSPPPILQSRSLRRCD